MTAKKRGSPQNMKSYGKEVPIPPSEVQRENGRKGGIASGKARRRKADMRESLELILSMKATGNVKELLQKMGYEEDEQTNANAIAATLYSMGIQGDHKALDTLLNYVLAVKEDERKAKESEARIDAMKANIGKDMSVTSSDDDDGDVVIYLPKVDEIDEWGADEGLQTGQGEEE